MEDKNLQQPNQQPTAVPTTPDPSQSGVLASQNSVVSGNLLGEQFSNPATTISAPAINATGSATVVEPGDQNEGGGVRPEPTKKRPSAKNARRKLIALIVVIFLALLLPVSYVIGGAILRSYQAQQNDNRLGKDDYIVTSIPLSDLVKNGEISFDANRQVNVNGQLRINNSFVLTPSDTPNNPLIGQFYLNQQNTQLYYYNGNQFIDLATGTQISQLNAAIVANAAQNYSAGAGLALVGNQFVNTGVLALPQDLTVNATPAFAGLNLGSSLTIGNGGTGATTAAGARVNLGAAASGVNADITSLNALTAISPTGGVNYQFAAAPAGTYEFCTSAGNCATAGAITGSGTAGRIAKFTAGQVLADSLLSEAASTVTVNGDLAVTGTASGDGSGLTSLNASNLATGTVADGRLSSNVALLDRNSQIFTGSNQIFRNTANSTTAFQVQNAGSQSVLIVDTTNSRVGVGNAAPQAALHVSDPGTGGDLFRVTDTTSTAANVFRIANEGAVSLRTRTDTTDAFSVGSNSFYNSPSVLSVDTNYTNYGQNNSFETDTAGWAALGTATISRTTTQAASGSASLQVSTPAVGSTGASFPLPLSTFTTYTLSFYMKANSSFSTMRFGYNEGFGNIPCASGQSVTTNWKRYSCTFTTGFALVAPSVYFDQSDGVARTIYLDAMQMEAGSYATGLRNGGLQLNGAIVSPTFFQNAANSDTAFVIQNATASTKLLVADTVNGIVTLNQALVKPATNSTTAFQVQNSSGQSLFTADTTNQRVAVGPAAVPANSVLTVGTDTTTASGGITFGTDTSLYRSASNTLQTDSRLNVNSSLVVTSGNAAGALQVYSGSSITNTTIAFGRTAAEFQFGLAAGAGQFIAAAQVGDLIQRQLGSGAITLSNGSNPDLSVLSGNVGIGVRAASTKLDVRGTTRIAASSSTAFQVQNATFDDIFTINTSSSTISTSAATTITNGAASGGLRVLSGSSTTSSTLAIGRTTGEYHMAIVGNAGEFIAGTSAGDIIHRNLGSGALILSSGSAPDLSILSGNIGIGVRSASTKLDVRGTTRTAATSTTAFQIQDGSFNDLLVADTSGMKLTSSGDIVASNTATGTTATTSGTGSDTTTVTLTGAAFANNDVVYIDNAGQDYVTRVVSGGGTATLTVSPAVTFENSRTVTKYNIQNIGATDTDYTTLSNRFFQGYFLGGIVAGAGSTRYADASIDSTQTLHVTAPNFIIQNSAGTDQFSLNTATGEAIFAGDLTVNGSLNATVTGDGSGLTGLNASNISSGTLADGYLSSNVGLLDRLNQTFTGTNLFKTNSNSTTALQIQNASSQTLFVADTTNQRIAIGPAAVPANGVLTIGTNTTTAAGGIYFGTDVSLYRVAASQLQVGGSLSVSSTITSSGNIGAQVGGVGDVRIGAYGPGGEAAVRFGSAGDTNLYRSAADTLRTDDALVVSPTSNPAISLAVSPTITTNSVNARLINAAGTFNGSGDGPGGFATSPTFSPSASISTAYGFINTAKASPGAGITITNMYAGFNRVDTGSTGGVLTNAYGLTIGAPSLGTVIPSSIVGAAINNQGAAGISSAVGLDISAQSGATSNIGLRIGQASTYSLQLSGTGGTAASGITFGTDTNLYRSAANTLKTDSVLVANSGVFVNNTSGTAVAGITSGGVLEFGTGLAARDTNLYRSASNTLKTDDSLIVQPTGGSTTAFQVLNSSGNATLSVDSTNARLGIGTSAPTQSLTINQGSMANILLSPTGVSATPSASGGTLATGTYYYKIAAIDALGGETLLASSGEITAAVTGPTGSVALSWSAAQGAASYRVYRGTSSGGQNTYYSVSTNSYVDTGSAGTAGTGSAAHNAYQTKISNSGATIFNGGNVGIGVTSSPSATLTVGGSVLFRNATDSSSAFHIQNAAGSTVFAVNTSDATVGIGTSPSNSTGKLSIATGYIGLSVNQLGTNDILKLQNNGTNVLTVNSTGGTIFKNSTNSTAALQIQNSSSSVLFAADTTNQRIGVGTATPSSQLHVVSTASGAGSYKYALQVENNPGGATARTIGTLSFATVGDGALPTDYFAGVEGRAISNATSGTIPAGYGLKFGVENRSTGTINTAIGVDAYVNNYFSGGTGTINNAIGLRVDVSKTTGTIGSGYGVYINDVTATSQWGVYQAGADDLNYFAGNLGLGVSSGLTSRINLGSSTAASGGIAFGTDTNLYRSAASTLKTDSSLQVAANLQVNNNWLTTATNGTAFGVGIGTASPTSVGANRTVLHVNDNTGNGAEIRINTTGSNARLYNNGTEFGFGTDSNKQLRFFVNGGSNSALTLGTDLSATINGPLIFNGDTTLYRDSADVLKTNDSFVVRNSADSATAFVVQNSSGTALLTADASNMTITVQKLIVSGDLTVNGHLITGGSAPSASVDANAGTSATCTVSGTDTAGKITLVTGSSGVTPGTQCSITFSSAYGAAPKVVIGPAGPLAAPLDPYIDAVTASSFSVGVGTAGATGTTYTFNYVSAQ